jgi:hypothetical protein
MAPFLAGRIELAPEHRPRTGSRGRCCPSFRFRLVGQVSRDRPPIVSAADRDGRSSRRLRANTRPGWNRTYSDIPVSGGLA